VQAPHHDGPQAAGQLTGVLHLGDGAHPGVTIVEPVGT
jgi:hypothetical protein